MWDTSHRTKQLALFGRGGHISVGPDGTVVLAGYSNDAPRAQASLWDTSVGKRLGEELVFGGPYDEVGGLAISPTGRTFATAGDSGLLRFWDGILWRDYSDLRASVCRQVIGDLTPDEWRRYGPTQPYHSTCTS